MSRNGVLHIRRIRPRDAGVYTCHAGEISANISVDLHTLEDAMAMTEARRMHILNNYKFITQFKDSMKQNSAHGTDEYTLPDIFKHFNHSQIPFQVGACQI